MEGSSIIKITKNEAFYLRSKGFKDKSDIHQTYSGHPTYYASEKRSVMKALKKYINSKDIREEKKINAESLGEALKENRLRCNMTQEFVAETLGVSRQAVSKWENGTSEPNTTNLITLSRLYKIEAVDLLECIQEKEPV